ncbi:MAG: WG repeat-containing protein [Deltaproteobacteria bacterium]|uniref:non-specific serine/threonine protein kinase n=1 Tax=Candidatus Zymogenus saltonus TaxID=2844893 RepID=A0A9D8KFN4_9DELT|nr:WG repeat-containing protein [Candidatus Zymogenus saltonus]
MPICGNCDYKNPKDAEFCKKCGARLKGDEDPFVGTIIEKRYEVLEKIAEGGMGTIYKAHDKRLDITVALKILHPELARNKKFLSRFENEAKTVAKLRHENIVLVNDTGPVRDTYFISMDYVDGDDLVEIINDRGLLSIDEAFSIASQVAEGLAYAHSKGILHRDIKPANIIIDRSGKAVITDFGISKALGEKGQTTTGTSIGTPEYMSLEQIKGKKLDGRTDIYSLGVVLYEMLTGKSPFRSDTGVSAIAKILSEEAEPIESLRPDIPGWALGLLERVMEKDREKRIETADEFITVIKKESEKETKTSEPKPRKADKSKAPTAPDLIKKKRKDKVQELKLKLKTQKHAFPRNRKLVIAALSILIVIGISIALFPLVHTCSSMKSVDDYDELKSGLYRVMIKDKWGYADDKKVMVGEGFFHIIIEPRFDEAGDFIDGIAVVKMGDKYGYIDRRGYFIADPRFDKAENFSEGLAEVMIGDKYGYIDKTGKYVAEPKFDFIGDFIDGIARVKINNKYGYIDKTGKCIAETKFDFIGDFIDGIAKVKINDKYGYIDKTGKYIAEPRFDFIGDFINGIARVKINDKYGYIDKTWKYIVIPRFDKASDFEGGRAKVESGGKWWYIDQTGELIKGECHSTESSALGYLSGPGDSCKFRVPVSRKENKQSPIRFTCENKSEDFWIRFIHSGGKETKYSLKKYTSFSAWDSSGYVNILIYSNSGSGDWKCNW